MLQLTDVHRSFGTVAAVRGVTFGIAAGATFGLLGPNGAGKTTTMRMILNILVPDRGTIAWNGAPIDGAVRRRFGYLPEERGIYGRLKVREQLAYFGKLHGLREPLVTGRIAEWMERLEIGEYADRPCAELSKGNQQKVQVACAALHEPEFLILDEPFSGLDPVNAEVLLRALRHLQSRGATLVLSSHQMYQIEHLCTDFCIISGGTVRAHGSLEQLRRAWPTRTVLVEPDSAALRGVLDRLSGARARAQQNGTLAYDVPQTLDVPALARDLVAAGDLTRLERLEPSLSDIYLRAIGEAS
jgi:ABC-2 type transport system ATP-binding protein